ncbi:MAG: alanine racemase [Oscillospiraceae bacterium]|nr:alanine racemase [Oscillospiraceae bacterium]
MERIQTCPNKLIVDTNAIKHNINELRKQLKSDTKIMPVIKANAYGTGVEKMLDVITEMDIDIIAVATVDEGIYLRQLGFTGEVFILNQPCASQINEIAEYNLTIGISSLTFAEELSKYETQFKVHLEIGTGFGRTGINPSKCTYVLDKLLSYGNIKVEGMYTHFACSDCDEEYTNHQIYSFEKDIKIANEKIKDIKYIHACNSAGIVNFPKAHYNLVRPGLMIYGYLPNKDLKEKIDLKPCAVLKSEVTFIKEVEKDFYISYAKSYKTTKKTTVLTIPMGYADGLRRILSNTGHVVINGKLAPIIGNICMDNFMVDGTDIPGVDIGTDVYIWDNENITVEQISSMCKTINYEILSSITSRVKREYI